MNPTTTRPAPREESYTEEARRLRAEDAEAAANVEQEAAVNLPAAAVIAAARVLCARGAEQCNVDADDSWKVYGHLYLQDAVAALEAAGFADLLEALKQCAAVVAGETSHKGGLIAALETARTAILKATGEAS